MDGKDLSATPSSCALSHVCLLLWIRDSPVGSLSDPLKNKTKKKKKMSNSVLCVISRFLHEYGGSTPNKLKLVDAYMLYIVLTGAMQFLYCLLVGTFPFNSFLSGFISCVGCFILAVCLRIQVNPNNKGEFLGISPERAFADFLFAHTVLHLVVVNFIG